MLIRRIPQDDTNRLFCHDCHSRAEVEILFGQKRPALRLCKHGAEYLAGFLTNKILADIKAGRPIRTVTARHEVDPDSRGNR